MIRRVPGTSIRRTTEGFAEIEKTVSSRAECSEVEGPQRFDPMLNFIEPPKSLDYASPA